MQAGAVGVCVQKTAEAEILAAGGIHDIYISNEVVAPGKLARVAALAHRLAAENGQLAIAVDSAEGVARLAQAMNEARSQRTSAAVIDVFVEIDVGQGRCGVPPGQAAVALVHEIRKHPALRFAGLQAYHGQAQHIRGAQQRREAIAIAVDDVVYTRKLIEAEGIPVDLVTGAGTGSMVCEAASGVFGELQAGSFLFMDADYAQNERDPAQPNFEHALFVKTQVIELARGPRRLRRRPQEPRHRFGHAPGPRVRRRKRTVLLQRRGRTRHPATGGGQQASAGDRPHALAGARALRPDGEPARLHGRRDRRPAQGHGGAHHQG